MFRGGRLQYYRRTILLLLLSNHAVVTLKPRTEGSVHRDAEPLISYSTQHTRVSYVSTVLPSADIFMQRLSCRCTSSAQDGDTASVYSRWSCQPALGDGDAPCSITYTLADAQNIESLSIGEKKKTTRCSLDMVIFVSTLPWHRLVSVRWLCMFDVLIYITSSCRSVSFYASFTEDL